LGLVAAVLVVAVVLRQSTLNGRPIGDVSPIGSAPSPAEPATPSYPVEEGFPTMVAGMTVLSVATANDLIQRGNLDGHAAAVAGYFAELFVSCPYTSQYVSPLVGWCRVVVFADHAPGATLCDRGPNGTRCTVPSGLHLAPFFMAETSGTLPSRPNEGPVRVVLIGHAGDARTLQCAPDDRAECSRAFVVDRVAWADGHDVPITPPHPVDQATGDDLHPRLSPGEAATAASRGVAVISVAAFRRGDISSIDPRWNLDGDGIVWIVRSLAEADPNAPTRPVLVSLVSDETGETIDAHALALSADYRPARLWTIATTKGFDCCAANFFPFFRVSDADGSAVHEGMVSGNVSGHRDVTTYGPDPPLVLPPGTYSVSLWLAPYDHGVIGPASEGCSTQITLDALDDLMLNARFPAPGQPCTFAEPFPPKLAR
jgi:hypothetical protein